jgi:hypothetical protein
MVIVEIEAGGQRRPGSIAISGIFDLEPIRAAGRGVRDWNPRMQRRGPLPWRVFQRLLPKRPTPKGCSNPISSERCRAEAPPKQWTEARKGRDLRKGGASACPTRPRPVFPSSSAGPPRPIRRNIVGSFDCQRDQWNQSRIRFRRERAEGYS